MKTKSAFKTIQQMRRANEGVRHTPEVQAELKAKYELARLENVFQVNNPIQGPIEPFYMLQKRRPELFWNGE